MSCDYWIGEIHFPKTKIPEVEALLKKHDLEDLFDINSKENTESAFLTQTEGNMAYGTASGITDNFLPEFSKLLVGTDSDGQVRTTEYDGEIGTLVLLGGQIKVYDGQKAVVKITESALAIGEKGTLPLQAEVIRLSQDEVLVLELKEK